MEEWLKSLGFLEVMGLWYLFKVYSLVVYIEEDGSWSCCCAKGRAAQLTNDDLLFSSLPEDQAKITLERIIAL